MSDYAMPSPWSVVRAAEEFSHSTRYDQPLDTASVLAGLENVLLKDNRSNRARLQHQPSGRIRRQAMRQGASIMLSIPLLIPVLWLGTATTPDASWPYPTTAVVSCIGALVIGSFHLGWRRRHLRHDVFAVMSVLYTVSTGLGLGVAVLRPKTFQDPIGWFTVPVWILLALCIHSAMRQYTSPRDPAWGHLLSLRSALSPNRVRFEVDRLHPTDQRRMLEERDQAVRVMVERSLLTDIDPDELATRALGELHLEPRGTCV